jgi:DNA-binding transcriptional LysR family regulator
MPSLFVVLEAIYREGNITRAGHQLNLTQPAISHALKRLRDLLKDPLFVRRGAHMIPTPFTRNMIDQVREALQILEVNLQESHQFDPTHTRRNFHISLWEYAGTLILPTASPSGTRSARDVDHHFASQAQGSGSGTRERLSRSRHRRPHDDQ